MKLIHLLPVSLGILSALTFSAGLYGILTPNYPHRIEAGINLFFTTPLILITIHLALDMIRNS